MNDFKMISLKDIRPDENQPRKIYDEVAMQELADSIKVKGVLQPVLVRPNGKGYLLVCGERRYRGATTAGLQQIPAVIRELSDAEALELQIIENLQRKDVHPMEEAVAFKSLLERKEHPLTVDEIAARIGKKPMFVRQRLKLNSLNEDWQKALFMNLFHLFEAIRVAALASEQQEELAKATDLKRRIKQKELFDISDWRFRSLMGDLKEATFDPTDPSLSPKFGACTGCPFNSAVASLFPDDAKHPKCTNMPDYQFKTEQAFKRNLEAAISSPDTILVSTDYYPSPDEIKKFEKSGAKVYKTGEFERVNFKDDDEFKKRLEAGVYLKGFVVIGHKGETIYVKLSKKSPASAKGAGKSEEKITTAAIDDEIKRIRDREKRALELDGEKIWAAVRELVPKNIKLIAVEKPLTQDEKDALATAMKEKIGYYSESNIKKVSPGGEIKKITDARLFAMMRAFILDVLISSYGSHLKAGNNQRAFNIIKCYLPAEVAALELDQAGVAERRSERVKSRLSQLQAQKKNLQSSSKPDKKAAAKKK